MSISAIIGLQWGDEGKAKVVDVLAAEADAVVRFQGGANAGHTVKVGDLEFIFHLVPSGMIYQNTLNIIGNGVVVDPEQLFIEIDDLQKQGIKLDGRLLVSERAHVVFPFHKTLDELREGAAGDGKIGTTKRGIGPAYGDKVSRVGLRTKDLLSPKFGTLLKRSLDEKNAVIQNVYGGKPADFDAIFEQYKAYGERLRPMLADTGLVLKKLADEGKKILFEGAQGTMLDIDHGTYPFVTSSNTVGPNMFAGVGFCRPGFHGDQLRIVGIVKAYCTRVGAGPFPTELLGEAGENLRQKGGEYGATTGRPRRCGWLDAVQVRYASRLSGVTEAFLTKLDILSGMESIQVAVEYQGVEFGGFPADLDDLDAVKVKYQTFPGWSEDISSVQKFEDLPTNARKYIEALDDVLGVPVRTISVGPKRSQVIIRD